MITSQNIVIILGLFLVLFSCGKVEDSSVVQTPPIQMYNVHFKPGHIYFATDGSMTQPVDSNAAKLISGKIDITFIYPIGGTMCFLDPVTRSHHNSIDDFYQAWLSNSTETRFYLMDLTITDFAIARDNEEKLIEFFETKSLGLIQHPSFPDGTLMNNFNLYSVLGYKNIVSGKRGLIYVREIHTVFPPDYYAVDLDIIREH